MVRGGKVGSKRNPKKRAKSRDQGSDDSDEDYVVSDEETDASEDAVGELEVFALEESFDALVEDENEEEDEDEDDEDYDGNGADAADDDDDDDVKEVEHEEEEEEEHEEYEDEDEDTRKVVGSKSKPNSRSSRQRKAGNSVSLKKGGDYFEEDDEEYDVNEEDDEEDDDEFAPDEDDYLDDEEDSVAKKSYRSKVNTTRRKLGRRGLRKKVSRGHKKRKKSSTSRNPSRQMGRKRPVVQKKPKSADEHNDSDDEDDVDFVGRHNVWREKRKNCWGRRKRRYVASSDSDFVSFASSGCDYTISEEEREQVREANEYCANLSSNSLPSKRLKKRGGFSLRSSSISNGTRENHDPDQQTKPGGIKGKEKVEEVNIGKPNCGICLSAEDKRRVRGRLDCCNHYFCFKCVMEWSKVETRCPLCKQRFRAITKPARSTAGVDLRDVVTQVPERDQVYQPSEEEIRGYLDPYENVICTECHLGGDDGLMLLCDVCDSPAHTYCVGLGREVPEGNWYCDGCRPAALGSSSSPGQDALPNQRTTNMNLSTRLSPPANAMESFDLNVAPSPHPSYNLGYGNIQSPRFPGGFSQATPPLSGAGAPTLSGRRWLFRQIQQMRSGNRPSPVAVRADGTTSASVRFGPLNYSIDQGRQMGSHHTAQETREPYANIFEENVLENQSPLVRSRDSIDDLGAGHLRRQAINDPDLAFTPPTPSTTGRALLDERVGMSSNIVPDQLHQSSSRSSLGSDGPTSPYAGREDSHFRRAKEELQSMVKSHLKSLSRDIGLGQGEFKEIARCSTHTVLAACGLEHRRSEAYTFSPPSGCSHVDKIATGQTSLMRGVCLACFDVFVRDVTRNIMNTKLPPRWLSLGL